jgi:hypothetical protein
MGEEGGNSNVQINFLTFYSFYFIILALWLFGLFALFYFVQSLLIVNTAEVTSVQEAYDEGHMKASVGTSVVNSSFVI